MRKAITIFVMLFFLGIISSGCTTGSKSEVQGTIPTYPKASLVSQSQNEVELLVKNLSLSAFENFYKEKMPSFGWALVREGPGFLIFEKADQQVVIYVTTYEAKYKRRSSKVQKEVLVNTTNAFVVKKQSIVITYEFSEKK